jgi:hypothetical protein
MKDWFLNQSRDMQVLSLSGLAVVVILLVFGFFWIFPSLILPSIIATISIGGILMVFIIIAVHINEALDKSSVPSKEKEDES